MAICSRISFSFLRDFPQSGVIKTVKIHDMMIRSRIGNSPAINFLKNTTAVLLSALLLITGISVSPAMSAEVAHAVVTDQKTDNTSLPEAAEPSPLVAMAQEVLSQLHKVLAPPATPDYSSAEALAVSLSYPLYEPYQGNGTQSHPRAYTGGGDNDQGLVHSSYIQARERAIEMTANAWNSSVPLPDRAWANCSAFTATIINNTLDPNFPSNLVRNQYAYINKPENGWVKVGSAADYSPEKYEPGDIFITNGGGISALPGGGGGHTFMWIGDHAGFTDVVAEASFGRKGSKVAKLPVLHINTVTDGTDKQGRNYEVWRFVGKPAGYDDGPDFSSTTNLAIDLAFPLYKDGTVAPPVSHTGGGRRDIGQASPWYYMARQRANELGEAAGAENLAPGDEQFAAASAFVSTVVQNTIDAGFPGLMIKKQRTYLANPDNNWIKVGSTEDYAPASYEPGDVLITRDSNSAVILWIGEQGGHKNVIADAAHGKRNSRTARLPGLRVSNLTQSGDPSGRHYDVYRYVGGAE